MDKTLRSLIRAAEKARKMDAVLNQMGYSNNPYIDIFGDIVDAVYNLVREPKDDIEKSATWWVMNADVMPEEDKLSILLEIYRKNRPARY